MKKQLLNAATVLVFILIAGSFQQLHGQAGVSWLNTWGGDRDETGRNLAVDAAGNVYATGDFSDSVYFIKGSDTTVLKAQGDYDVYITKHDAAGNFLWVKGIGGELATTNSVGISVDGAGNVYIAGYFNTDTIDADPGPLTYKLSPEDGLATFVVKLDAAGNFIWAKSFSSAWSLVWGFAMTADRSGNIYTTGLFMGYVDFDPGQGITDTAFITSNGIDIFVTKLDSAGNFIFARSFAGDGNGSLSAGTAITTDTSGNILTTGLFSTKFDFNPDPADADTFFLAPSGSNPAVFITKLTPNGDFIWAKSMEGDASLTVNGIQSDQAGNLYLTGTFEGTADFDPDTAAADTFFMSVHNIPDGSDAFILKLAPSGNFVWANHMGGKNRTQSNSIALDPSGNIFITGTYADSVDFDPGAGKTVLVSEDNYVSYEPSADIFVSKYDNNGAFLWAKGFNGDGEDIQSCLAIGPSDHIYVLGTFVWLISYDSATGPVEAKGGSDVVLFKLDQDICHFTAINTNVYQSGDTLRAGAEGAGYTWIDCDKQNSAVPGANSRTFIPVLEGNYAVVVTVNNCRDTSDCHPVRPNGITDAGGAAQIRVYPNPASGTVYIHAPYPVNIVLTDMRGTEISRQENAASVDVSGLAGGVYFLQIRNENNELIRLEKVVTVNN